MEKIIRGMPKRVVGKPTIVIVTLALLLTSCVGKPIEEEVAKAQPVSYNVDFRKMFGTLPVPINYQVEEKVEVKKYEVEIPVVEEKKEESWIQYKMTHYAADCKGCSGITSSGYDVRNTTKYKGMQILAVDPRLIDQGSIVEVDDGEKVFQAIALDTGGAIKGKHLDLLVRSEKHAFEQGVKYVKLKVVRDGWGEENEKTHQTY